MLKNLLLCLLFLIILLSLTFCFISAEKLSQKNLTVVENIINEENSRIENEIK